MRALMPCLEPVICSQCNSRQLDGPTHSSKVSIHSLCVNLLSSLSSHRQSTRLSHQQGREIKGGFHGFCTLSEGGLLLAREVDERHESGELIDQDLADFCGKSD